MLQQDNGGDGNADVNRLGRALSRLAGPPLAPDILGIYDSLVCPVEDTIGRDVRVGSEGPLYRKLPISK